MRGKKMPKLQITREHALLFVIFAVITACVLLVLMSMFMNCSVENVCAGTIKMYESACICP